MLTQTQRILGTFSIYYMTYKEYIFKKEHHFYSCIPFSQSQRNTYCQLNAKCHTCLES